jgi:hypothetical protein
MVTNAAMQRASAAIQSFSLFLTPFHMLDLVSMVPLVCGKERAETMARLWRARG